MLVDLFADSLTSVSRLLASATRTGVRPGAARERIDGQAGNTTDYLLVVGVLQIEGEPRGVVEFFQRPGAPPATQHGYLKFVQQMCELANDYLRNRR